MRWALCSKILCTVLSKGLCVNSFPINFIFVWRPLFETAKTQHLFFSLASDTLQFFCPKRGIFTAVRSIALERVRQFDRHFKMAAFYILGLRGRQFDDGDVVEVQFVVEVEDRPTVLGGWGWFLGFGLGRRVAVGVEVRGGEAGDFH